MIVHQLIGKNTTGIELKTLGQKTFEGIEVFRLVEDVGLRVPSVQGVVNPARFVSAFWSSHASILTHLEAESMLRSPGMSPVTFFSPDFSYQV